MAVFRQIILMLLIAFITIGDYGLVIIQRLITLVQTIFSLPQLLLSFLNQNAKKTFRRKKQIKKSRTLYKASSSFRVEPIVNYLFSPVRYLYRFVLKIFRKTAETTGNLIKFITSLFRHKKRKGRPKKARKPIYKPSLLYKFKFFFLGAAMSFLFLFVPLLFLIFVSELPDPENLSISYIPKTTKIYDRNNVLLYEIYANQNRTVVQLEDIPKQLKQATIAIEDKDFYDHPGFDLRGIIRAFVSNISTDYLQGGSTITQQLIKSAFLTPEPTIKRKVKEVVLALWSEQKYSKDQILEMYFNYVPYGGTAWGVESASEIYFGKKVGELTLAESAFLAGLPRAPSIYSPFSGEGKLWKNRQKEVLDAMVRDGYITQKQANEAFQQEMVFESPNVAIKAPHFVMYVKDILVQKYGINEVERGGLQVRTSLDYSLQQQVEQIVTQHVDENSYLNVQNGAAMVTDPRNGDVLAMVGSRNYFDSENDGNVNVATSLRQPGSTIKIVTYTLALENGFTEASMLDDSPITIASTDGGPSYTPVNYDGSFHGRQTLRNAFANSYNIPAVRVAQQLGVHDIISMGRKMGISTWKDPSRYGLSITLGGGETKMTDLTMVFGTIANKGKRVNLNPIVEVKDAYGKKIYGKEVNAQQVVSEGTAFIISDILSDNNARSTAFGTNSPLHIPGKRVSVKTGTTDNKRDNWTVGFTSEYVVATWVGNNDNTPMSPNLTSGVTGAAPMWNSIMTSLLDDITQQSYPVPDTIVTRNCYGRPTFFVRGTENSVNCRFSPIRPTGNIQSQ